MMNRLTTMHQRVEVADAQVIGAMGVLVGFVCGLLAGIFVGAL